MVTEGLLDFRDQRGSGHADDLYLEYQVEWRPEKARWDKTQTVADGVIKALRIDDSQPSL